MKKSIILAVALATTTFVGNNASAASRFTPPPADVPVRGVVAPILVLKPLGAFDVFVSDLRESLQMGAIPDISIFHKFSRLYDDRYYSTYPIWLEAARDHYMRCINEYLNVAIKQGLSQAQAGSAYDIAQQTRNQVSTMIADSWRTASTRIQGEKKIWEAAANTCVSQIAAYRGNPATLTMPSKLFPAYAAGDSIPMELKGFEDTLYSLASQQLRKVNDVLGSGSARSNQWLLLIRQHRQRVVNLEAHGLPNSVNLSSLSTKSISEP